MLIALAMLAASQAPAAAQAAPAQDSKPKEQIICHVGEAEVGTHMRPKPVCMKKSDWDLVEQNTQRELTSFKERSALNPGMAGTPH